MPLSSLPCAQRELNFLLFPSSSPAWGDRQRTKSPPLAILDLAEQRARGRSASLLHITVYYGWWADPKNRGEGCSVLVGHLWALPWSNFFLPFLGEAGTYPHKVSLGLAAVCPNPLGQSMASPAWRGQPLTPLLSLTSFVWRFPSFEQGIRWFPLGSSQRPCSFLAWFPNHECCRQGWWNSGLKREKIGLVFHPAHPHLIFHIQGQHWKL